LQPVLSLLVRVFRKKFSMLATRSAMSGWVQTSVLNLELRQSFKHPDVVAGQYNILYWIVWSFLLSRSDRFCSFASLESVFQLEEDTSSSASRIFFIWLRASSRSQMPSLISPLINFRWTEGC
jgi:hypothetical protein